MLHRLPEAEVGPQRQRRHQLCQANLNRPGGHHDGTFWIDGDPATASFPIVRERRIVLMLCGRVISGSIDSARSGGEGEAIMATDAPAWGAWTTHYDSVGQAPNMTRDDTEDGLVVSFGMDRLELDLGGDQDAPFAGAIGLPPFPPVPPVPVTVSLQARRRFVDEFIHMTISGFDVLVVRS
jgi:hypothetical protein